MATGFKRKCLIVCFALQRDRYEINKRNVIACTTGFFFSRYSGERMTMSGPPRSRRAYFFSPEQREIITPFMQPVKMHVLNSNLLWELTT